MAELPGGAPLLRGACMCGTVCYEISARPLAMYHCHCGVCRAASGASYATNIAVPADRFSVTTGRDALAAFESSPGKQRYFCSACGSPIYSHGEKTSHYVSVRCGTLRDPPGIEPSFHTYVAYKAPWVSIQDSLRQYA